MLENEKIEKLRAKYLALKEVEVKNNELISKQKDEIAELRRLIFGAKKERHVSEQNPEQLSIFEQEVEEVAVKEPTTEEITYTRKKKHPGRRPLPDHLPVNEIIIEPEQDTTDMVKIGCDIVDTLDYKPASLKINRYIFPKYTTKDGEGVVRAKMPNRPIEKGIAEAGLLAHFTTQKFVYHIPFYRTLAQFKQLHQVDVPKSTVNDWFIAVCTLMDPLYTCLKKQILKSNYIQADESPIKVLDSDKSGSSHQGYQWVYHAPEKGYVLFEYQKGRGKNGPKRLLEAYTGYLQTDGYVVYDKIAKTLSLDLLGCMAHARRYFFKAKDNDAARANYALERFKQLYAIERHCKQNGLSVDQIQAYRIAHAQPILEQLIQWAITEKEKVAPKSAIGKAFTYLTLQWHKLTKYLEHGKLLIDNNLIENTIRPLALGRKNYLFAGSQKAAQRIAIMYSFFGTCKLLGINPFIWMREVLRRIPNQPINKIEELLPGDWVKEIGM